MAAGRPLETPDGQVLPALMEQLTDVPTCRLDTPMEEVAGAIGDAPFVLAIGQDVVLGKVMARSVDAADPTDQAREHLIEGPTTVRADEDLAELRNRMERADTSSVIVTTPEGRLLGVYFR